MNTAILLYDGFTALDAIGPYEVLSRLPGARATFVASEPGPVRTDNGMLSLVAERSLEEMPRAGDRARAGRPRRGRRACGRPGACSGCARRTRRARGRRRCARAR